MVLKEKVMMCGWLIVMLVASAGAGMLMKLILGF